MIDDLTYEDLNLLYGYHSNYTRWITSGTYERRKTTLSRLVSHGLMVFREDTDGSLSYEFTAYGESVAKNMKAIRKILEL